MFCLLIVKGYFRTFVALTYRLVVELIIVDLILRPTSPSFGRDDNRSTHFGAAFASWHLGYLVMIRFGHLPLVRRWAHAFSPIACLVKALLASTALVTWFMGTNFILRWCKMEGNSSRTNIYNYLGGIVMFLFP